MKEAGLDDVPVAVVGIIPPQHASALKSAGSARSTRRRLSSRHRVMADLLRIVEGAADRAE